MIYAQSGTGKTTIVDFIDSMSKDELLSELGYIGREYADYDLIAPKILETDENTTENTDKALSQEEELSITQQLIEHIKNNLGIHVHDAAEMEQYLKEYGFNDVQEAFSKRQLLNKDLGKDEIKAIQQYIKLYLKTLILQEVCISRIMATFTNSIHL